LSFQTGSVKAVDACYVAAIDLEEILPVITIRSGAD